MRSLWIIPQQETSENYNELGLILLGQGIIPQQETSENYNHPFIHYGQ